jgi:hypothetical protein
MSDDQVSGGRVAAMGAGAATVKGLGDEMARLNALTETLGQSLARTFSRGVVQGKGLDATLQSLRRTLLQLSLRAAQAPLQSLLTQAMGGLTQGLSAAFSGAGGTVTPFASGGVVASPTYFPLGRGAGLMGESGAAPVSLVVNISTPDVEGFRRSEAQVAAALARAVGRGRRGL